MGLPLEMALEQVELLGTEVVPELRKEMAARRAAATTWRALSVNRSKVGVGVAATMCAASAEAKRL